uniref:Uncharacterized protein n=1 Tax=Oryza nivara TaxID=4536 RepID=A0A0E0GLS8_ORYNI
MVSYHICDARTCKVVSLRERDLTRRPMAFYGAANVGLIVKDDDGGGSPVRDATGGATLHTATRSGSAASGARGSSPPARPCSSGTGTPIEGVVSHVGTMLWWIDLS